MRVIPVLVHYVWWHYTGAIADLVRNYGSFVAFLNNFFSIPVLLRNLAAPWKRLSEAYPKDLDVGAFFGTLIINTLMRAVGIVTRLAIILTGLAAILASFVAFMVVLLAWLGMPLILIYLFTFSFRLLMV